jgi:hypothetical protein
MVRSLDAAEVRAGTFTTLLLSLAASVAVASTNTRAWGKLRSEPEWRRSQIFQARTLVLSTLLAILTTINAVVAYAGNLPDWIGFPHCPCPCMLRLVPLTPPPSFRL